MLLGIDVTLLIGPTLPIPAPPLLTQAIRSIEVTNTDEGRDGFQINFTVGRSGPTDLFDYPLLNNPLLKPFNRVIIIVTFGLMPKVLIDGIITNQQLTPSNEPGESMLTITGEDVSVMMDLEEKSVTHPNQPDNVIVSKIILSYAKYGLVPIVIPPVSMDIPLIVDRVPSQQSTDLEYIRHLAETHDYVFYIEPIMPGVNNAYWGPLNRVGIPQKALSVNMGPESNVISINTQYNALGPSVVEGSVQDRTTNQQIPVVTFGTLRPPLSRQPAILANMSNRRKRQFRASGLNMIQAYGRAQAETDRSTDAITVTGELDVLRYGDILRARKLVGLRGAGDSYDGFYYVKNVTHRIQRNEYKQSFTLTRDGLGSLTPVIPP